MAQASESARLPAPSATDARSDITDAFRKQAVAELWEHSTDAAKSGGWRRAIWRHCREAVCTSTVLWR